MPYVENPTLLRKGDVIKGEWAPNSPIADLLYRTNSVIVVFEDGTEHRIDNDVDLWVR